MQRLALLVALLLAALAPARAPAQPSAQAPLRVAQIPIRTDGPKTLDPAKGSTQYESQACAQVYETLLQWKYLARPLELEPLLLAEMPRPTLNGDGTQTWRFTLKKGVRFQDDPCFPGGKGRELVATDVFYSWRRLADPKHEYMNFWLLENMIVGFDKYKQDQADLVKQGKPFDYEAPVGGLRITGDHTFEVTLVRPIHTFLYALTLFQTSAVPREAVEHHGPDFPTRPVGTGPFVIKPGDWRPGQHLYFTRNPTYRDERYPADPALAEADRARGLHLAAGRRLPLLDRIEISFYVPDNAMWLDFKSGKLGFVQVPAEFYEEAFILRTQRLRPEWQAQGFTAYADPLLEFIFRGFNMEDPVVGGYTEERKALRQAISLAIDLPRLNRNFYNGLNTVFDGMIPPGIDGYPPGGQAPVSYRGPDLDYARELLAKAGYPGGRDKNGNPLVIEYYSSRGGNSTEMTGAEQQMVQRLGVSLNVRLLDFSELIEAVNKKKAPIFSYAWGLSYPDAETTLALFYSRNKAPGSNAFNYDRPEYDRLYELSRGMAPGPERTAIHETMRDMVLEDAAIIGSFARVRNYLIQPWLLNYKPTEVFDNWMKYLDVDDARRLAPR